MTDEFRDDVAHENGKDSFSFTEADLVFGRQIPEETQTRQKVFRPSSQLLSTLQKWKMGEQSPPASLTAPEKASLILPYLTTIFPKEIRNLLATTQAGDIVGDNNSAIVQRTSSLAEVIRAFESSSYVIIRALSTSNVNRDRSEIVVSRIPFLKSAMNVESLLDPLESIMGELHTVDSIDGKESLENVFLKMLSTGQEELAVIEDNVFLGVLTCSEILIKMRTYDHRRNVLFQSSTYRGQSTKDERRRSTTELYDELGPKDHTVRRGSVEHFERRPSTERRRSIEEDLGAKQAKIGQFGAASGFSAVPLSTGDSDEVEELAVKTKNQSRALRVDKDDFSLYQKDAQAFCLSWCSQLMVAMFVALDLSVGFAAYLMKKEGTAANAVAMCCIVCVFVYERAIRTYGFWLDMLKHPFWLLDCLLVDFSAVVAILLLVEVISRESKGTLIMIRVIRLFRIFLIIRNLNLTIRIRRAVSAQKTRFRQEGFDLDLTYVTKNCIAMSVPGMGTAEASYRNPLSEVQRFFIKRHPNNYLIFNLCKERDYDAALFEHRVIRIPVEDHNPPLLSQIVEFLREVGRFMEEDPANCIAVHCKGGKGRTGTMICAWLLWSKACATADEAMEWFEKARTGKKAKAKQGVSQPSQQRYVRYTEKMLADGGFFTRTVELRRIVMKTCPQVDDNGGCRPWFIIEQNGDMIYNYKDQLGMNTFQSMKKDDEEMKFEVGIPLQGDVRIIFFDHDDAHDTTELCGLRTHHYVAADDLRFFFWFHTGFIDAERVPFLKEDIDIACHDHTCQVFQKNFQIELHFALPILPDGRKDDEALRGPLTSVSRPTQALIERCKIRLKSQEYLDAVYVPPAGSLMESGKV